MAHNASQVTAHIEVPGVQQNGKGRSLAVYAAVAENRALSHVTRGENGGRDLGHVSVTRVLKQIGTVDHDSFGKDVTLTVPPGGGSSGLRLVVFLQDPKSKKVVGAAVKKF
jgi:hypothetical protein